MSLSYTELNVVLIKGIQKQKIIIEEHKERELQDTNSTLETKSK